MMMGGMGSGKTCNFNLKCGKRARATGPWEGAGGFAGRRVFSREPAFDLSGNFTKIFPSLLSFYIYQWVTFMARNKLRKNVVFCILV
jgi:hypothetical protein